MLCSVFNNYSTSARWIWVGYNHFISNKHEWNNCFIKKLPKNQPILILFSILSRRIQLPYLEIAWYSGSYTMMANPIRALELHYLMIQFLIKIHIYQTPGALPIIIGVALDFLKVVRLVFWSGVVGPGTNFRSLALRAHCRAKRSKARLVSKSRVALPKGGSFFRLKVYEWVRVSLVKIYDRVKKSVIYSVLVSKESKGLKDGIGVSLVERYDRVKKLLFTQFWCKRFQRANKCILLPCRSRENFVVSWFIHI